MHSRVKGNRAVRKAIAELTEKGYLVSKAEMTHKYAKQKDAFGLFDLICLKEEGPVMLIQITSNRPHTHKHYDAFAIKYPHVAVEQWVWIDRAGFKKYQY